MLPSSSEPPSQGARASNRFQRGGSSISQIWERFRRKEKFRTEGFLLRSPPPPPSSGSPFSRSFSALFSGWVHRFRRPEARSPGVLVPERDGENEGETPRPTLGNDLALPTAEFDPQRPHRLGLSQACDRKRGARRTPLDSGFSGAPGGAYHVLSAKRPESSGRRAAARTPPWGTPQTHPHWFQEAGSACVCRKCSPARARRSGTVR